MISPKIFYENLRSRGATFFTGVPDSLLKNFCAYIETHVDQHVIAANEGNALAIAAGHYLATRNPAVVYLQNSGIGNLVNPLISLMDEDVYRIPVLLCIGWRGEPGKKDEPQHVKQGKVTIPLCETLGIPHSILPDTEEEMKTVLDAAFRHLEEHQTPYALIVQKGTFEPFPSFTKVQEGLTRELAISTIADLIGDMNIIVATTGKTGRELFEYRVKRNQGHQRDFLTVGSMGHASQIALGIAMAKPFRNIYCLDGDGAFVMHMGGTAIIGSIAPRNLKHIILNNGVHDSVGGQPTASKTMDIPAIAKACGYEMTVTASNESELRSGIDMIKNSRGLALLEIKVIPGARSDLGRPTTTPQENKQKFMEFL